MPSFPLRGEEIIMKPSPLQGEHTSCDRLGEGMVATTDVRRQTQMRKIKKIPLPHG